MKLFLRITFTPGGAQGNLRFPLDKDLSWMPQGLPGCCTPQESPGVICAITLMEPESATRSTNAPLLTGTTTVREVLTCDVTPWAFKEKAAHMAANKRDVL